MTPPSVDLHRTDVIRMAQQTHIDIFTLYYYLELPRDPISQGHVDRVAAAAEANDNDAWQQAVREKLHHAIEMGNEEAGEPYFHPYFQANRREFEAKTDARNFASDGVSGDQLLAINVARQRAQSGVPWGTEVQAEAIFRQALEALSVEDLVKLHCTIPEGADTEHKIVLRMLALRFFQKTETPPTP